MPSKVIAITLYRRPEQTRELLSALHRCWGIEDYRVIISCDYNDEHRDACDEVKRMAHNFLKFHAEERGGTGDLSIHDPRLGVDLNKLFILPKAFEHSEYAIFLEDDTPPARDALRFFEACDSMFRGDESVISISGYNRYLEEEEHRRVLAEEPYLLDRGGQFTPWGWATWKDRYENIVGMDGQKYKDATGDQANGLFDHNMCRWMREHGNCWTIYPVMPRTNHSAWENAEHTPNESFWRENEYAPFGAWSQDMPDPDPTLWRLK